VPIVRNALPFLAAADTTIARRPRLHVLATLWQLATIVNDALTMWVLLLALGVHAPLPLVFASFMVSTLLRTVSIVPAGIGPFEAASVATLTLANVPITAALAATLAFRALSFWLPLGPGLWLARAATRRRVGRGGAMILVGALVVVGIGTGIVLHTRAVAALDQALLAAALGRAHPEVAAAVEVEHAPSPITA